MPILPGQAWHLPMQDEGFPMKSPRHSPSRYCTRSPSLYFLPLLLGARTIGEFSPHSRTIINIIVTSPLLYYDLIDKHSWLVSIYVWTCTLMSSTSPSSSVDGVSTSTGHNSLLSVCDGNARLSSIAPSGSSWMNHVVTVSPGRV